MACAAVRLRADGDVDLPVVYHLRDNNADLVQCWEDKFSEYPDSVKVSQGDILKNAPAVDAIVSPGNSFGFMDGGIDKYYLQHFGQDLQDRVQKAIRMDFDGELLVGQAAIVSAYGPEDSDMQTYSNYNQGAKIKYVIIAPTMRIPMKIDATPNAYLAFKAVILAVRKHNMNQKETPIETVLVPGLGTASGGMPENRCAWQMLQAYDTLVEVGESSFRLWPEVLEEMAEDHKKMCRYGEDEDDSLYVNVQP